MSYYEPDDPGTGVITWGLFILAGVVGVIATIAIFC